MRCRPPSAERLHFSPPRARRNKFDNAGSCDSRPCGPVCLLGLAARARVPMLLFPVALLSVSLSSLLRGVLAAGVGPRGKDMRSSPAAIASMASGRFAAGPLMLAMRRPWPRGNCGAPLGLPALAVALGAAARWLRRRALAARLARAGGRADHAARFMTASAGPRSAQARLRKHSNEGAAPSPPDASPLGLMDEASDF